MPTDDFESRDLNEALLDVPVFPREGLSPAYIATIEAAFRTLGCTSRPASVLVSTLVQVAQRCGIPDAVEVGQTFALVIAAAHSLATLPSVPWPLANEDQPAAPATSEWCHLATRHYAACAYSQSVGKAFDAVITQMAQSAHEKAPAKSLAIDYGVGVLWRVMANKSTSDFHGVEALGKMTRLAIEIEKLADPQSQALHPCVLGDLIAEVGLEARYSLALVHACAPRPDRFPLVALAAHPLVYEKIRAVCHSWMTDATNLVEENLRAVIVEALQTISAMLLQKLSGLRLFGFAPAPNPEPELLRTMALAVEALSSDTEQRAAWDVQRWGGFFSKTTSARFFPLGLCVLALDAASVKVADRVHELLALRDADGFRYFENFSKIPPDCDDLGLALILAARLPDRDSVIAELAWPIEVFIRNTGDDGAIPVWFEKHLREPMQFDAPSWRGSHCLAAAANVLVGAIELGVALPSGFLERSVRWIVRKWSIEGEKAAYFYGSSYTRFILSRLGEVAEAQIVDPQIRQELQTMVGQIRSDIVMRRRADGSLGSILDTACFMAALACASDVDFDPWPSLAFLCSRQDADGLWPHQPLYLTLGKDNVPAAHGSRAITAALCLYALARWKKRIESRTAGAEHA